MLCLSIYIPRQCKTLLEWQMAVYVFDSNSIHTCEMSIFTQNQNELSLRAELSFDCQQIPILMQIFCSCIPRFDLVLRTATKKCTSKMCRRVPFAFLVNKNFGSYVLKHSPTNAAEKHRLSFYFVFLLTVCSLAKQQQKSQCKCSITNAFFCSVIASR